MRKIEARHARASFFCIKQRACKPLPDTEGSVMEVSMFYWVIHDTKNGRTIRCTSPEEMKSTLNFIAPYTDMYEVSITFEDSEGNVLAESWCCEPDPEFTNNKA